ncbi:hypothetical protein ACFWGD_06970 [Corynebacterium sp. NPDC060344]|uniref:hypothetical protein n=1 Tax=Corynebacterium sp. NPDC060344 TaxID=3347101 RepID=UPI00365B93B9
MTGTLLACIAASLVGELLYVGTSSFTVAAVGCFVWGVASALFGPLIRNALVSARRDDMATTMPLWRASQSLGNLFPMPWIGFLAAGVGAQAALAGVAVLAVGSAFAVVGVLALSARASHRQRG